MQTTHTSLAMREPVFGDVQKIQASSALGIAYTCIILSRERITITLVKSQTVRIRSLFSIYF